jgi:hypothetical protein
MKFGMASYSLEECEDCLCKLLPSLLATDNNQRV